MATKFIPKHADQHGYSKQDWSTVSDNPTVTKTDIAKAKPFVEGFPELYESIKRPRGKPRVDNPKEASPLRLDPDVVAKFKANGKNWRANMNDALRKAAGL